MAKDNKLPQLFAVRKDTFSIKCLFSCSEIRGFRKQEIMHIQAAAIFSLFLKFIYFFIFYMYRYFAF